MYVCMYVCNIMKCHQDASGSFARQIWMPRCDACCSEEIPVEEAKAAETVEPRQWCTHGKHTVWSEYTCIHLIIIIITIMICDANIRKFYSCMRKVEPCNSNLIWPHDTSRLSCRRSEILFGSSLSLSIFISFLWWHLYFDKGARLTDSRWEGTIIRSPTIHGLHESLGLVGFHLKSHATQGLGWSFQTARPGGSLTLDLLAICCIECHEHKHGW